MNYFFSQIFLDIEKRISEKVPQIRFIEQQLGQLHQIGETERPPLSYPAVLIDFPHSGYSNMAGSIQLGEVQILLQLVFESHSSTWNKAPEEVKKKGLEYLETEQKLYAALQGWSQAYFTPLNRLAVKSHNLNPG
ncbi:MAG: hypothetical protein FDW93_00690 [Bergeyella sp.]|nr:hypothetical protein [Bergeyella sp.]